MDTVVKSAGVIWIENKLLMGCLRKDTMNKRFIELDSLIFSMCSECEYDMNCPSDVQEECPIMAAIDMANYIEIDEDDIAMEY